MGHYLEDQYNLNDPALISVIDELSLWSAPFGLKLLDTVQMRKNMTALDIGFGTGFPLLELAQRLGSSSTVYGIDPWNQAMERARQKLSLCRLDNVILHQGVAEQMPFADDFFDLIISNNGINNVNDIQQTLKECQRVGKHGAQFVFTMNLEETMAEFYRVFTEVLGQNDLKGELKKIKEHIHQKRRPVAEMKKMLAAAGFRIKTIVRDSFDYRYVDGSALFNHFFIKLAFLPAWKELVPKDKLMHIFSAVEGHLNEMADRNGEVVLTIPFATFDCRLQ
jgi:arsenite methyltransferase